ncbi:hypothetical protein C0989_003255 [Termitomyces sp. Mn162]|nr:hypothetical protein C0989_003255 [Termitomyces sp. Mn162]
MKVGMAVKGPDGQAYLVDTAHLQKIQVEATKNETTDFASIAFTACMNSASATPVNLTGFFEYQGFMAVEDDVNDFGDELRVSINRNNNAIHNSLAIRPH